MSSVDIQSILSSLTLEEKVCSLIRPRPFQSTHHLTYRSHFLPERTYGRLSLYLQKVFPTSRLPMVPMALEELPLLAAQVLLASLLPV